MFSITKEQKIWEHPRCPGLLWCQNDQQGDITALGAFSSYVLFSHFCMFPSPLYFYKRKKMQLVLNGYESRHRRMFRLRPTSQQVEMTAFRTLPYYCFPSSSEREEISAVSYLHMSFAMVVFRYGIVLFWTSNKIEDWKIWDYLFLDYIVTLLSPKNI